MFLPRHLPLGSQFGARSGFFREVRLCFALKQPAYQGEFARGGLDGRVLLLPRSDYEDRCSLGRLSVFHAFKVN